MSRLAHRRGLWKTARRESKRHRAARRLRNRRALLQALETRQLLAGDIMAMGDQPAVISTMEMHQHDVSFVHSHEMNHGGHTAVLDLVPMDQATHVAQQTGVWSDPETWRDGEVPTDAAHVVIPTGLQVTVDGEFTPEIKTLRVDGTLSFATDRNTQLRVDTLVTSMTGHLMVGSSSEPVEEGFTARIVFADDGAIDRSWDPTLLSRGALLHGKTTIHGAAKASFETLAAGAESGAIEGSTQIKLSAEPVGWQVGDQITVAGVDPNDPSGDEVVTITGIDGRVISFEEQPLLMDHIAPRPELQVHVANLTRNVILESENTEARHRGHVMFMHTNDVDVRFASFEGLGRTDKSIELNDWRLISGSEESVGTELTEVEDLGGFNVRGRYSVHFHRGGAAGDPGRVQGSVVRDDPGWAYVNHSSNVDFIENVSHNVAGAAYNTEAGDEVGSFLRNIAIRTVNANGNPNPADQELDPEQEPDARVATQDFGWQGDGFWFHGPGVRVEDNVVSGASGHAYIYWALGLVEKGMGERLVSAANLPNGDLIDSTDAMVRPKQVPVPSFDGNTAYNAQKGLNIYYLHTDNRDDNDAEFVQRGLLADVPQSYEEALQSTFSNFKAWNVSKVGINAPYSGRLTFHNIDIMGTGLEGSIGIKLDHFANQNNFTLKDLKVDGYQVGIAAPRQGLASIDGAEISAPTDLRINVPDTNPRDLSIRNVQFQPLTTTLDSETERVNIDMDASFDLGIAGGLFGIEEEFFDEPQLIHVPAVFQKDRITFGMPGMDPVGLYFNAQDPGFVPVPDGSELSRYVPTELVGLSNAELQRQFGISFSDRVTSEDAMMEPGVQGGVVGSVPQPFENFPPERDAYWQNVLIEEEEFDGEEDLEGEEDHCDANLEDELEEPDDDSANEEGEDESLEDDEEAELDEDGDESTGDAEELHDDGEDGEHVDEECQHDEGFEEDTEEEGGEELDTEEPTEGEGDEQESEYEDETFDDGDIDEEEAVHEECDDVGFDDDEREEESDSDDSNQGDSDDEDESDDRESGEGDELMEDEDSGNQPVEPDVDAEESIDQDEVDADSRQNPALPMDVNNDGRVSALDALTVINRLSQNANGLLRELAQVVERYYDVNGDTRTSALDALIVINFLNQAVERVMERDVEGEPAAGSPESILDIDMVDDDEELFDV
ncbi:MAG: G8 domain-containing protein, partial [Planctomycetota bacterium]